MAYSCNPYVERYCSCKLTLNDRMHSDWLLHGSEPNMSDRRRCGFGEGERRCLHHCSAAAFLRNDSRLSLLCCRLSAERPAP